MTTIQVYAPTIKESWENKLLSFMVKLNLKSTEHASMRCYLKAGMLKLQIVQRKMQFDCTA